MPVQYCPRCRRANPELAIYCYFDGFELRVPTDGVAFKLPSDFVFPSGRRCRTYDEFAQGCQEEWAAARDLLHQGIFGRYFNGAGRADLVRAAQDANAQGSPDAALATFLASLPGVRTQTPRLDLNPRRMLLGNLLAGETRQLTVTISNSGQGQLQGTASISEGQDLVRLADAKAVFELPIDTPRQQQLTLYLNTRGLPANQGHGAKLTVVTNGGVAEVPLRLELVARPFAVAPFQGVKAQRELAERMRSQPKAAVPLLESGEVRRWFEANGWTYPVAGPEVRGVAAVQQFFEALGLSKPPTLQLSSTDVRLRCKYPDSARYQLTLSTPAKKWVYATISSTHPWLKVPQPQTSGPQQATFQIEVDSSRMTGVGSRGEGKVLLVANGGQKLEVRVTAEVTGLPNVRTTAPVPPVASTGASASSIRVGTAPAPATGSSIRVGQAPVPTAAYARAGSKRSSFIASLLVLPLVFLLVRLALVPIADGFLREQAVRTAALKLDLKIAPTSPVAELGGWLSLPWPAIMLAEDIGIPARLFDPANPSTLPAVDVRDAFVGAFTRLFVLLTWWLFGLLGALLVRRRSGLVDMPWGFVAGGFAGLAGMATLACAFLTLELGPELIWHIVTGDRGGPFAWVAYELLAVLCWLGTGLALAALAAVLPPLRILLAEPLQRLLAALLRGVGLRGLAEFWWPGDSSASGG